ncbi:hypothetical protein B0H10DRAFT_1771537 [Mycena sp. CBHHK59/15]|nr:hypothetical protein B0H10DRAFT_1771537 [Mycena sp. CBHHK59/15]
MSHLRGTLLSIFRDYATNPDCRERHVVECGEEYWTYEDLDVISTGLALELEAAYGVSPTVAIIAENLPYTFALIWAVWKLRGIVAPIDYHTPADLLRPMLRKIAPSCVAIPSGEKETRNIVQDLTLPLHIFEAKDTTMTALCQRFTEVSDLELNQYPLPDPSAISIYIFTSSASDVTNIKCVPQTHQAITTHCRSRAEWLHRTFPTVSFQHTRALGWSPFSHIISICNDIGTSVILAGGCYIFALIPSSYVGPAVEGPSDVPALLLQAMLRYLPDCFSGVPWVLEGLMKAFNSETDPARQAKVGNALRKFKVFLVGGAPTSDECKKWARGQGMTLLNDIGMTELGGALFWGVIEEGDNGWPIADCLISDAEFVLIDDEGNPNDSEGELQISSRLIARGYVNHDSYAFTLGPDGVVTFRTGDRYIKLPGDRIKWLGRNDDFIQLASGESVDPRVLEKSLDTSPVISHSCIIGNNFLRGSAQFLCALIELNLGVMKDSPSTNMDISRAIRNINRSLPPPLRIRLSRVFILEPEQHIPLNRKRQIFRKKLEALFGGYVTSLAEHHPTSSPPRPQNKIPSQRDKDAARDVVLEVVADSLQLSKETLELDPAATFAELGMDSAAAVIIVGKLNQRLGLNLSRNACHTYIDLSSLTTAILGKLSFMEPTQPTSHSRASTDGRQIPSDIVVVGQAVRLPGGLNTPESFWEALVDMREDLLVPVPQDRWDHASFYRRPSVDGPREPCDISFEKAGFIDIASFDNTFFGISSPEALSIAPAVRLTLETAFEALENANIPVSRLKGSHAGIFVASGMDIGYSHLMFAEMGFNAYSRFHGTGISSSTTCGRLSYLLDVHGPSVSIDTACSGGMVALDQAAKYLVSGQAETAIVCGVNTHAWPGSFGFLSAQQMCSPNSRCATFSSGADGYVPSEGAVSLILKTRRAALRDGDTILAVIKASDTQHNGKSQGLVAPSSAAQASLQRSLLAAASMTPSEIDFVEAHGTGTSLGDLIEMEGINAVFQASHTSTRPLVIGAAKACIGHTEVSAGLVGIVKAIRQLSTGEVTGLNSLAAGKLNPEIDTSVVPLHIPSDLTNLHKRNALDEPYRALVVAYGFAGTLAGAILEAPTVETTDVSEPTGKSTWMLFVLSAKSRNALHKYLQIYLDFCLDASATDFTSICYTSCVGRELYRHRFACVVKDLDDLVQRLKDQLSRGQSATSYLTNPRLVLAFPGQGSQFYEMATALAARFPDFRAILADAASTASSLAGFDILPLLVGGDQPTDEIDKSAVAQICIFVYQYSVCQFLRRFGIVPDAVLGNSLGEISAAVEAGALSYDLGLQFVVARAKFLSPDPDRPAGMAAIAASETTILQSIQDLCISERVVIAVFSGPNSHVVSGDLDAVGILISQVEKVGIRATLLNIFQGFHSPCIASALPRLQAWIDSHIQDLRPLEIPIFSTVSGEQIFKHESLHPHHWIEHAQKPVQFQRAATQINYDKSFKNACILDIGPTPTAWTALQMNDLSSKLVLASSTKKGKDQELAFLTAIASLIENGVNPNLLVLFGTGTPKTAIPTYPFQRQRHYPDYIPSRSGPPASQVISTPSSDRFIVDRDLCELLDDHRIQGEVVLPGAAMVDFFARSRADASLDIRFHRRMVLESAGRVCHLELGEASTFSMYDGPFNKTNKVCSGNFSRTRDTPKPFPPSIIPPISLLSRDDVYSAFSKVQFGPLFRNILSIKFWDGHVDGLIEVRPTPIPEHDRVRALDACIHMFGACRLAPPSLSQSGAFLPLSLDGYSMYVDALPSSFICRYRLPVVTERDNHVVSTAFEVRSHSGELLASCRRYSVAWVHMGGASGPQPLHIFSFQQMWMTKELSSIQLPSLRSKFAFFGRRLDADWIHVLSKSATESFTGESVFVELNKDGLGCRYTELAPNAETKWLPFLPGESSFGDLLELINIGTNSTVILDATFANDNPKSASFSGFWQQVLWLMKLLARNRDRTFNLIVVSTASGPVPSTEEGKVIPTLGAMVQGMLRVFRREVGLKGAWGLDLPGDLPAKMIAEIVEAELEAHGTGMSKDNMVVYRYSDSSRLVRLVPELRDCDKQKSVTPLSGVAVIVGMGSIGFALSSQMIATGSSVIVFIGRRPITDVKVAKQLSTWAKIPARVAYLRADVSDLDAARRALQDIAALHGDIKNIVYTAAFVSDATISSVTSDAFDCVLRPKVHGAYNLHVVAEELKLKLDSFVLLSSISVPLGNPGQVAYVAANSFLDSLAAYRQSMGLPGVSIQLGPWESELVDNLPPSSSSSGGLMKTMTHKEGLPLILRAFSSTEPVQIIADLDTQVLSKTPVFATDPLFAALVASVAPQPRSRRMGGAIDAADFLVSIIRGVLELGDSEPLGRLRLDLDESLTACGIDSIAFNQIRAKLQKDLGVDLPMVYLSDAFSVNDMIRNVRESSGRLE